jgi:hypothetical protein
MTARTKAKLDENTRLVCEALDIPYNPFKAQTDPRAQTIYNALLWTALDVEKQCLQ